MRPCFRAPIASLITLWLVLVGLLSVSGAPMVAATAPAAVRPNPAAGTPVSVIFFPLIPHIPEPRVREDIPIIFIIVGDPELGDVESIEIANDSATDVDMTGWRVANASRSELPTYTIPQFTLPAGESLIIYGADEEDAPEFNEFYWNVSAPVWRVGDVAQLRDAAGGLVSAYVVQSNE